VKLARRLRRLGFTITPRKRHLRITGPDGTREIVSATPSRRATESALLPPVRRHQ
jgi:hypothetical protein